MIAGMPSAKRKSGFADARQDRRYLIPVLEVAIGEWRFQSINWSMGGMLLDGIAEDIGLRVRGTYALSGSRETMPFVGTVVRVDPESGYSAICFDDPRAAQICGDGDRERPPVEQFH